MDKNWIVIGGSLVNTAQGGGFEFFGPYSEEDALLVREHMRKNDTDHSYLTVELLSPNLPNRIRASKGE